MDHPKFTEIIDKFGINLVEPTFTGEQIRCVCPFHPRHANHRNLQINNVKNIFHCFSCGAKGNVITFISKLKNMPEAQVISYLRGYNIPALALKNNKFIPTINVLNESQRVLLDFFVMGMRNAFYNYSYYKKILGKQLQNQGLFISYLKKRGITLDTAKHFNLFGNIVNNYVAYFINEITKRFQYSREMVEKFVDTFGLKTITQNKYPAIYIPYYFNGNICNINTRFINPPSFLQKYMRLRNIAHVYFFNEDALDEYDTLYLVEGEFNAIILWQAGIRNVMSFGGKKQLNDRLINKLYGKSIVLYFDVDNESDIENRNEIINKMSKFCRNISYFQLPKGKDINDYYLTYGKEKLLDYIANNTIVAKERKVVDCIIQDVKERKRVSLNESRQMISDLVDTIGNNFDEFSGKTILINFGVGSGKTYNIAKLISTVNSATLVISPTHYMVNEVQNFIPELNELRTHVHLKGRSHPDINCKYANEALQLCSRMYSQMFKLLYCLSKCEKSGECKHPLLQMEAKNADVVYGVHSHVSNFNFLVSAQYGNNRRALIIIDEMIPFRHEIIITQDDVAFNKKILSSIYDFLLKSNSIFSANEKNQLLLEKLVIFINDICALERCFSDRCGISFLLLEIDNRIFNEILNLFFGFVSFNDINSLQRNLLYDLICLHDGAVAEFDEKRGCLYYYKTVEFPKQSCNIILSGTTKKKFFEAVSGKSVDLVLGEQFYIERPNVRVVQLLSLFGGRRSIFVDNEYLLFLRRFVYLCIKKNKGKKIVILTSLGTDDVISQKSGFSTFKRFIFTVLNNIARFNGVELVDITASDLERGIDLSAKQIPVIHYGIIGTNSLSDYDILIELNAYYYSQDDIANGVRMVFNKAIDQEWKIVDSDFQIDGGIIKVKKRVYQDDDIQLYLESTQMADMMQAEGRVLRDPEKKIIIYRLHNVNIEPYPKKEDVFYSPYEMLLHEFDYDYNFVGVVKKAKEHIRKIKRNTVIDLGSLAKVLNVSADELKYRWLKVFTDLGFVFYKKDDNIDGYIKGPSFLLDLL